MPTPHTSQINQKPKDDRRGARQLGSELPSNRNKMRASPPALRLPNIYLGTMTFAWGQSSSPVTESVASQMLNAFADFHDEEDMVRVDTARIVSSSYDDGSTYAPKISS